MANIRMSKSVNDENYLWESLDEGLRQTCLCHYKQDSRYN